MEIYKQPLVFEGVICIGGFGLLLWEKFLNERERERERANKIWKRYTYGGEKDAMKWSGVLWKDAEPAQNADAHSN